MIFILLLVTILSLVIIKQWKDRQNLPKGPTPLPLIGNLHQIAYTVWKNNGIVKGYKQFENEFGKVFTLWVGPLPTVYISDFDIAHETHVKRANTFSTRFAIGAMNLIREGRGIIASNGDFWQDHRRFALATLRNFGLGRNIMETRIMEELNYRLGDHKKKNSVNNNIETSASTFFDLLVGSIINQLLISERFEQEDAEFEKLKTSLAAGLEKMSLVDLFLPLTVLKSKYMKWRQDVIHEPFEWVYARCQRNIKTRLDEIKSGKHEIIGEGDDFMDAYLLKIKKDQKAGVASTFNYETLAIDLYDLWLAGQETTSTTLTWGGVCLLNHPEVVKKIRAEILNVTGGTRDLSLTDRLSTPYLNATINEIQRIASILNLNLFRITTEDTTVAGLPLKAGTAITTNISQIHTDETLYKDSRVFNPDRFMDNDGLEKKLIPFGIGKRSCLGESLARAELYLILGNIVLNYDLKPVGQIPQIETPTPFAILKRPPTYNICFVPIN